MLFVRTAIVGMVLAIAAGGAAAAASPPVPWVKEPSPRDLATAYPRAAAAEGIDGEVMLNCGINNAGALEDCEVVSEIPAERGFATAARNVAKSYQVAPVQADGAPTAGLRVNLPVKFGLAARTAKAELVKSGVLPRPRIEWLARPTSDETAAAKPELAQRSEKGGSAITQCEVGSDGGLSKCVLVAESPRGWGFGEAALTLSLRHRVELTEEIKPGSVLTIPFSWPGGPVTPSGGEAAKVTPIDAGYPAAARAAGLDGDVVLICQLTAEGMLKPCHVLNEEPEGFGFGEAALGLSAQFRLEEKRRGDPKLLGASLALPFVFKDGRVETRTIQGQPQLQYAGEVPIQTRVIKNPDWVRKPSGGDIASAYPSKAIAAGIGGAALIMCMVNEKGLLEGCRVMQEKPTGAGFGEAALKMAGRFRLAPRTVDGEPVAGARVTIPIRFTVNGGGAPRLSIYPGDVAALITVVEKEPRSKRGLFPCPSAASPDRRCRAHAFEWAKRPPAADMISLLVSSDQLAGRSLVECGAKADGELTACRVGGVATPRSQAAIQNLMKRFKAPAKAADRTPMTAGRILIEIDWAEVRGRLDD